MNERALRFTLIQDKPDFANQKLYDTGQVAERLCALVFSPVKENDCSTYATEQLSKDINQGVQGP